MPCSTLYFNPAAKTYRSIGLSTRGVSQLQQSLPDYAPTPLVPLPNIAKELGLAHVLLKDESHRFGLPSFKILGASWTIYRTVAANAGLPPTVSLQELGAIAREQSISLVTCSEGNWGRAVGRMSKYLGIPTTIYTPHSMDQATQDKISGEGAHVEVVEGDYNDSIQSAITRSQKDGDLLVMDTSWPGYEKTPQWVVEGYTTLHSEVDDQLRAITGKAFPTHAIASVGVGSWAHSVVLHYKASEQAYPTAVITVEPTTAACLQASLKAGKITPILTGDSIMCGMNCGTVSTIAWPALRDGVDASVTISDVEAHETVLNLRQHGVRGGPCSAAPLATLKKLCKKGLLGLGSESIVTLYCTEGSREYITPELIYQQPADTEFDTMKHWRGSAKWTFGSH